MPNSFPCIVITITPFHHFSMGLTRFWSEFGQIEVSSNLQKVGLEWEVNRFNSSLNPATQLELEELPVFLVGGHS